MTLLGAGTAGTAGTDIGQQCGESRSHSLTQSSEGEATAWGRPELVPAVPAVPAPTGTPARHAEVKPTLAEFFEQGKRTADMADPLPWMEQLLRAVGSTRQPDTEKGKWQCPAHAATGEHQVSLKIARGCEDGRLLLFCHAGCSFRDILRALKLPGSVLMYPPPTPPETHAKFYLRKMKFPPPKSVGTLSERGLRFEVEHPYGSPPIAWKMRYRHPTTGEKDIRWESLNPRGERGPGLMGRRQVELPLYRERDLRPGIAAGEPILLVESESSADALTKAGYYATTWAGGAADPPVDQLREVLGDHTGLIVIPDNDAAGRACLARLRVVGLVPASRVLLGDEGEDARDLLKRLGPKDFAAMVAAAMPTRITDTEETNP